MPSTSGQSGPWSDGNEGVLRIPQNSNITGTSPSDCLVSFPGHSLAGSYPSAEKQSVYSTVPADLATLLEDYVGRRKVLIKLVWMVHSNRIRFTFLLLLLFPKRIFPHSHMIYQLFLSNTNNLHIFVWFQVFLSNTNNYMVSSDYFQLEIIICLYTTV